MAGINVENVNIPSSINVGVPFQVRVEANNRNVWVDPFSNNTCEPSGQYGAGNTTGGQPGRIKMEVFDADGNKVEEEGWINFCAPTDAPGRPDPVIPFDVEVGESGNYTVKVTIKDDIGSGHTDTVSRSIYVTDPSSGGGGGNGGNGGNGSNGGDGGNNNGGGDNNNGNNNSPTDSDGDGIPDSNDPYPNDPSRPTPDNGNVPMAERVKKFANENPKVTAAVGLFVGMKMLGSGGGGGDE